MYFPLVLCIEVTFDLITVIPYSMAYLDGYGIGMNKNGWEKSYLIGYRKDNNLHSYPCLELGFD